MSYLYKKPVFNTIPATNEIVIPTIPEKINIVDYPTGLNGTYCKEITYEEHLKNLEMMCKADRAFMKRVKEFCEEHKEENFPNVPDASESPSEHRKESK